MVRHLATLLLAHDPQEENTPSLTMDCHALTPADMPRIWVVGREKSPFVRFDLFKGVIRGRSTLNRRHAESVAKPAFDSLLGNLGYVLKINCHRIAGKWPMAHATDIEP